MSKFRFVNEVELIEIQRVDGFTLSWVLFFNLIKHDITHFKKRINITRALNIVNIEKEIERNKDHTNHLKGCIISKDSKPFIIIKKIGRKSYNTSLLRIDVSKKYSDRTVVWVQYGEGSGGFLIGSENSKIFPEIEITDKDIYNWIKENDYESFWNRTATENTRYKYSLDKMKKLNIIKDAEKIRQQMIKDYEENK